MFFVKATYRGETRKLTFPSCSTFPAFDELCEQLCRVFPLNQGFTISRLLFSPTRANSIRLLVGQKVQSAEDYLRYIDPYKNRLWPDAMLRLTILDGGPLNTSSTSTKKTTSYYSQSNNATFSDYTGSLSTETPFPDCIPPPILLPSYSATTTPIPNASPLSLQVPGSVSNGTVMPVCSSIGDNKKEIQTLLHNFMHDLNGILASTFPAQNAETPRQAPRQDIAATQFCSRCKRGPLPTSYYCTQCSATVCYSCFGLVAAARCDLKAGWHRLERRTSITNDAQQSSPPPVPQPVTTQVVETTHSGFARTPFSINSRQEIVHNAVCDLCDSGICGVRYKCVVCPDFDSCSSCFVITNEQHPNHSFVKITDPADYIHRPGSRSRHNAVCNVCNGVIYGIRYKCVHPNCPDYDLCERCESHPIPLHPESHPMIKLKAAGVSVDVLRSWITENSVVPSLNAVPAVPLSEPVLSSSPKNQLGKEAVTVVQNEPQPQNGSYDWRSALLSPEMQVSNALFSPPIFNETSTIERKTTQTEEAHQGSVTPSTLEYTPSEASEIGDILSEVPSAKAASEILLKMPSAKTASEIGEILLEMPSAMEALSDNVAATFVSASPPLLANNLDKEQEFHVPILIMHVEDSSVLFEQILPPGAEFIKTWRVQNTGNDEWPETTELIFTGGDCLTQITAPVLVGSVSPGAWVEISTHLLKAPTVPGNYLSCWSLRTLQSGTFGDGLWVSVNVVEQNETAEECLSSSSIMKMPELSPEDNHEMMEERTASSTVSGRLTEETLSGMSSPADLSFEGSDWQDCPAEQEEYVILYDDSSSEEE